MALGEYEVLVAMQMQGVVAVVKVLYEDVDCLVACGLYHEFARDVEGCIVDERMLALW